MPEGKKYGPSRIAVMRVCRVNEMGAFLDAETGNTSDDILLHATQQTSHVKEGDVVEVFLYLDPKRRLTASMRTPKLKEGQIARMKVINVIRDGAFLDVGAERGIFLPFAGMRGRPQVGEIVWAKLYTDKSGRLAVTMEVEDELRRSSKRATGVKVGDKLHGSIYNINESGAFLFTDERYIVHIPHKDMPARPKVGEEATVRITYIRDDGRLNGSLREVKEKAISTDAKRILEVLDVRGRMPYDDKTSPDIIRRKFQISKAAFKRALGHLLKEGKIEIKDGWTHLKGK